MKLVLAEKPSVAQSIAKVLGATKREDGYIEGNGYIVSWCVGHLVELAEPEAYDEKYSKYFCDKHTTPSVNEIALGVGIPKTTAFRYLVEMDNRGMLEYDGKSRTIRTPMIKKFAPDSAPCPLVGSIPCGSAQTEEENIREYVSLPVSLFGNGRYYILEASGDSMVDAGIDSGDLVVIRTDSKPKHHIESLTCIKG